MRIGRLNLVWHKARNWIAIPLFSALLLIPCFWQSRIQSADLSSHIYNAWLVSQIHQGAAPGLWISSQSNNVLFDLMLEWLFMRVGSDFAQRLAVSISVLVFAWGAILFIFRIAGRNWWFAAPCVAMLAYGFIFHMGFFNFYLSMGLCLWYLAIIWGQSWRVQAIAAPLLIVAWIAHPFPVVWAVGTAGYVGIANNIQPRRRLPLLMLGLAVLTTARYILTHRYSYSWSLQQVFFTTGSNQAELFGVKYMPPFAGLLMIWLLLLRRLVKSKGAAQFIAALPFQLWLLNAAAVILMPNAVVLPQFGRPFAFITDRLSFGAALMMCAVIAAAPVRKFEKFGLAAVAILFLGLLYADNRELNQIEDRMVIVVQQLPPGQRVIAPLLSQSLRSLCLQHDLDRACIGHCFSYANYEPSSQQFRIRARPENGIVLSNYSAVDAVAGGTYVVQSRDLPLYLVDPCGFDFREVCSRPLQLGEIVAKRRETAPAPAK